MKKYVLYTWNSDNGEGGTDVCYAKDFMSDTKFNYSNWHPNFLAEFDNLFEAVKAYVEHYGLFEYELINEVWEDMKYRLYCFHYDKGEYDEAQKYEQEEE